MKVTFFMPPTPLPPPQKKNNNNLWDKSQNCNDLSTGIHPSDPMKATLSESNDPHYRIMNK